MKLVHAWANEFVTMPKPEQVRGILDAAGLPVESIGSDVSLPPTVVVGLVRDMREHPNADRLRVTRVDVGENETRTIVCGAPNVAAGQHVCVALPGTVLPNGTTIATAAIRGVASDGMLCSARELGLGGDADGILLLPKHARTGTPVATALPGRETVYDVSVTPNRSDCLSVFGLAREIAAAERRALRRPSVPRLPRAASTLRVALRARKQCPWYSALRLTGVRVAPSPSWLAERLAAAGLRTVNNVVDVTNYCMLELGQPLHAFDAASLDGDTIVVRLARRGERLVTLDGVERELSPATLVIADAVKPIAMAGVMGGAHTGVTERTADVVLESAVFAPQTVYDAAHDFRISSESAQRFSKGIDPAMAPVVLARAAGLLCDLAHATVAGGPVTAGSAPKTTRPIPFSLRWLNGFLGTELSPAAVRAALTRLGMRVVGAGDRLRVTPPTYRHDIAVPEDCAEEVARRIGYNALPRTVPPAPGTPAPLPRRAVLLAALTEFLVRTGAHEHVGYAYVPRAMVTDTDRAVAIRNPLSSEQAYLRTSLVPGLLRVAGMNARRYETFRLFEVGTEYRTTPAGFEERSVLALLCAEPDAVRALKGMLKGAIERAGSAAPSFRLAHDATVAVLVGDRLVGTLTEPDAGDRSAYKLPPTVACATLNLAALERVLPQRPGTRYRAPAPYPPLKRDIAFWVAKDVPYATLEEAIRGEEPLLQDVDLFDVFEQGTRRSVAFHVRLQAPDRTLSAAEADALIGRVFERLRRRCGAEPRKG